MSPFEFCKNILDSGELSQKLKAFEGTSVKYERPPEAYRVVLPCRSEKISFSDEQIKFPKAGSLKLDSQRGKALHFFANHELLAIEMMAQAICQFPDMPEHMVRSLVGTIEEEQKHFKLYHKRMLEFDIEFGDYPLNSFFWNYMDKIKSYQSFFAVVSLTFEQANLDFAKHYESLFRTIGDEVTADILKTVYEDEIKHVARGYVVLKRENAEDIWSYYQSLLPSPLTPARAKGMIFDEEGRSLAGFSGDLISKVKNYQSDFNVTNRKSWKS